mmetsp:Transcript_64326/g.176554  ORF Transcript_64326/g.176554 Transcript_64326/m.176554 type:complete len:86 (-) Transcript_64326:692-949(-)
MAFFNTQSDAHTHTDDTTSDRGHSHTMHLYSKRDMELPSPPLAVENPPNVTGEPTSSDGGHATAGSLVSPGRRARICARKSKPST